MRQGRDNGIHLTDDGRTLAINLGADYCAEHEWGIKGLESKFGFGNKEKLGLKRRQVTLAPEVMWLPKVKFESYSSKKRGKSQTNYAGFFFGRYVDSVEDACTIAGRAYAGDARFVTQWSEGDFCVLAKDPEDIARLKEIFDAFPTKDVVFWLGGGGVFQNAGLVIGIASRLSKEVTDHWHEVDDDRRKIKEEVDATGIEAKLKKAGKDWFALAPKRNDDGSLIFWLNPCQQRETNYGWFTLQELEQWAENKGPIPKTKS